MGLGAGLIFESYNFGVGGYNTGQKLFLLRHIVLETNPDLAVLGFTLNDADPPFFKGDASTLDMERRDQEDFVSQGVSIWQPPATWLFRSRIAQWVC